MSKTRILGVVTARSNSKGLPGKNIKELGGKPLIAFSIEAARDSSMLTRTIVSTDGEDIAEIARRHGGDVPFIRPRELALDTTPHVPVLQHALNYLNDEEGESFEYVVTLQPTSPFRVPDDIDGTIKRCIETGADSAVSITKVEDRYHPIKMKKRSDNFLEPYCMPEPDQIRRQDFVPAYKRSSAVYVTKTALLVGEGLLYGDTVAYYEVPSSRSIDIDDEQDWLIAEYKLTHLRDHDFPY